MRLAWLMWFLVRGDKGGKAIKKSNFERRRSFHMHQQHEAASLIPWETCISEMSIYRWDEVVRRDCFQLCVIDARKWHATMTAVQITPQRTIHLCLECWICTMHRTQTAVTENTVRGQVLVVHCTPIISNSRRLCQSRWHSSLQSLRFYSLGQGHHCLKEHAGHSPLRAPTVKTQ